MSVWVMFCGGQWKTQGDSSLKRYTFPTEQTQAIPSRIPVTVLPHTVPPNWVILSFHVQGHHPLTTDSKQLEEEGTYFSLQLLGPS